MSGALAKAPRKIAAISRTCPVRTTVVCLVNTRKIKVALFLLPVQTYRFSRASFSDFKYRYH